MKIALLGYGNMGKEVVRVINGEKKHQIVTIVFKEGKGEIREEEIKPAEVVIDFTSPAIVLDNIKKVSALGKNMVVGTTGWYENLKEVERIIKENNIGFIYAPNFSIGANIYFKIVGWASQFLSQFENYYDVFGLEIHHHKKKDSPSGTALKISQEILRHFKNKKIIQTEKLDRQIKPEELHFVAVRGGRNPGFHQVRFDSSADEIMISHSAHNREGFARGAILAVEFIKDKKGFYTFDDVLKSLFG